MKNKKLFKVVFMSRFEYRHRNMFGFTYKITKHWVAECDKFVYATSKEEAIKVFEFRYTIKNHGNDIRNMLEFGYDHDSDLDWNMEWKNVINLTTKPTVVPLVGNEPIESIKAKMGAIDFIEWYNKTSNTISTAEKHHVIFKKAILVNK